MIDTITDIGSHFQIKIIFKYINWVLHKSKSNDFSYLSYHCSYLTGFTILSVGAMLSIHLMTLITLREFSWISKRKKLTVCFRFLTCPTCSFCGLLCLRKWHCSLYLLIPEIWVSYTTTQHLNHY
jgi:hypothetical protein